MIKLDAVEPQKTPTKRVRKKRGPRPPRSVPYELLINKFERIRPKNMNLGLLLCVLGLAAFGLAMVYSASWYNSTIYHGTKYYFFTNQLIGFVLGLIALTAAYMFDYRLLKKWYVGIYVLALALLVAVFIPGIGISRLGASRWVGVGGFTMQPSEVAKFAFVIFAASIATKTPPFLKGENTEIIKNESNLGFLNLKKFSLILGAGLAYCALVLLEPNLSITLCLGASMFVVLFLCGAKIRHLVAVAAPALVALPIMLVAEPYRVRRLLAFIDPWAHPKDEGFQLIQSLFGLGNGGFFGVGYGHSTQKHMFLPFAESDFIFSIIGEEFGFIGSIIFMAVLFAIIYKIFMVGARCEDRFGKFLCFGIGTVIFIQSAINLAVVTGSIPPTGVPLPFVSFGGTSLAVMLGAIGIVLNIDKNRHLCYNPPNEKK